MSLGEDLFGHFERSYYSRREHEETVEEASKLKVPKMKYILCAMEEDPCETPNVRAQLNAQFAVVEIATALAWTRIGKTSAVYIQYQETRPMVMANEQTKTSKHAMMNSELGDSLMTQILSSPSMKLH